MSQRDLLTTYLKPQWKRALILVVLLLAQIGLTLVNPQIIRYFLDTAQVTAALAPLLAAGGIFLAAAFARQGVMLAATYLSEVIAWRSTNALREDVALHCLRLDMPFHKLHAPGELIERIDGDVSALANFLSTLVLNVASNLLLLAGVLVVLWIEDWRVGVGVTLYVLFALLVMQRLQHVGVKRWAESSRAHAEFDSYLEERLGATEDIRSCGAERHILDRLGELVDAMLHKNRSSRLATNAASVVSNLIQSLGYALGLGAGALLYTQGQITIGTAYLIVYYIASLGAPLEAMRREVQDLQRASGSIRRVNELLAQRPEVRDQGTVPLPPGPLGLSFENVSFAYEDGKPALDGVTFQLMPGQTLGLLGRTGSGKSTLTRLLFRLYDPQSGDIRLFGANGRAAVVPVRDVPIAELRDRVAMVTQDVQLFEATIRDNLTLFDRRIDDARIEAALQALGLWEWIQALPRGLDTPLAPGERGLSAGEAQLLAFARVFLKAPGLVVLDEASSRLDPGTERLLSRAVDRMLQHRTGLIIAHRLNTVQRADLIAIFEQGRLAEFGPRPALEADPASRYAQLLKTGLDEMLTDETDARGGPDKTAALVAEGGE